MKTEEIFKNFNLPQSLQSINRVPAQPAPQVQAPVLTNTADTFANTQNIQPAKSNKIKWALALASIAAIAIPFILAIGKNKKPEVLKFDSNYKKMLQAGLEETFGIKCKVGDLDSIAGPEEFSALIKKFKPENFNLGQQGVDSKFHSAEDFEKYLKSSQENLKKYYNNFANGTFRVSLHTHSDCSDGRLSPKDFLESAKKYADKIAAKGVKDDLPPFTIALTDHDNVKGCQEIISIIAQDPKRYKNLKFVAGAELSVKADFVVDSKDHFDLTGLALNPFDKKLTNKLDALAQARRKTVQEWVDKFTPEGAPKVSIDDLIARQARDRGGKSDITNMAGVVSVRHAMDVAGKILNLTDSQVEGLKKLSSKDIPLVENVIEMVKENGGYTAVTHPLKSFWGSLSEASLSELKNKGVDGIEACHQYSPGNYFKLSEKFGGADPNKCADNIFQTMKKFAEENGMFLSGGTDSHRTQVFIYHPGGKAIDDFVNSVIN